jgi:GNAT superfamily N-acetyltransferase
MNNKTEEMGEMSVLEITIRNAVKSDWENMWELLQLRGGTDSKELAESRFISMIQMDEHFIPIAIVEGKAVGYGWVQDYGCHLRTGTKLCRFHDLFVRQEYRKKGIASALFAEIQSWAKEKGATWLQWNANPTSTHFYKKLGFTPIPEEEEGFPFFEIKFKESPSYDHSEK